MTHTYGKCLLAGRGMVQCTQLATQVRVGYEYGPIQGFGLLGRGREQLNSFFYSHHIFHTARAIFLRPWPHTRTLQHHSLTQLARTLVRFTEPHMRILILDLKPALHIKQIFRAVRHSFI